MCLLFFNINDDCNGDEFRLVLVNNRDELWQRPTTSAGFWTAGNQPCISGLDQEPGREGGTWLGASGHGRIACLVNLAGYQDPSKQGRGSLVTDFLGDTQSTESYVDRLSSQRDNYNGFVLTMIELKRSCSTVVQVNNDRLADHAVCHSKPTADEFFSVGNSPLKFPWRKVSKGREKFSHIVKEHRSLSARDSLKEELFSMMASKWRYTPDPQLEKNGQECDWPRENIDAKSALFVWDPVHQYGTRTTTVLLMDGEGNCDYTEKTLQTPVSVDDPQWTTSHYHYKLHFPDSKLS